MDESSEIKRLEQLIEVQQRSIDALEQQIATTVVGMFEQGIMIEALTETVIKTLDTEAVDDYKENVRAKKIAMIKAMEKGANALSGDG